MEEDTGHEPQEVQREIEETFGLTPTFFKPVPDYSSELVWQVFKRTHLEEGAISQDVEGNEEVAGMCSRGYVFGNGGAFLYFDTPDISC